MDGRLVLLHGWGANGEDLKPLGDRLARECSKTLDVVCLEAPELHPDQPGGRQWYGLFPAQWDAVPAAVERLKAQLQRLTSPAMGRAQPPSRAMAPPWEKPNTTVRSSPRPGLLRL